MRIEEPASGLAARAVLLADHAPENAAFLWDFLADPRQILAIHAMWTGPEISAPIPVDLLNDAQRSRALPLENATITPQQGDIVLTWLAPRVWGGGPDPIFDIGIFYGSGARLLFPIGWQPGSVVARVPQDAVPELAAACGRIRRAGACTLIFSREGA
jgi:hypothetical protein